MPKVPHCTTQIRGGKFCDAPQFDDAPFPICLPHALEAYRVISALMKPGNISATLTKYGNRNAPQPPDNSERGAVVYYIEFGGGLIKIGYTTRLKARMSSLSVLPSQLLAIEDGGSEIEGRRHFQFAADRVDPSRELFRPSEALLAHIAQLNEARGVA